MSHDSGEAEGEEHMKIILIPLVFLMMPIALLVVAFNVALAYVESKLDKDFAESKPKEKNT